MPNQPASSQHSDVPAREDEQMSPFVHRVAGGIMILLGAFLAFPGIDQTLHYRDNRDLVSAAAFFVVALSLISFGTVVAAHDRLNRAILTTFYLIVGSVAVTFGIGCIASGVFVVFFLTGPLRALTFLGTVGLALLSVGVTFIRKAFTPIQAGASKCEQSVEPETSESSVQGH